ncbi:FAD-dependent oxidoreductase [Clostridium perfringens]|uniref:FAD-dependent oxidoreductase n=1 Tax=Clostridium perfringens TaxID=1502 RepID=UPI00375537D3
MSKIYDLVIIGGGPAGLSAGIYAGRAKMNTLIIEKGELGGQVNKTFDISNYPGSRNTNGPKLMSEMRAQAEDFKVKFMNGEVLEVSLEGDIKEIKTDKGLVQGRSVIIATGAAPRQLGFKGEEEFTGRGVAYCATCDGQFFEGLEVFVIGAGFAAAEEAIFLTRFASKVTVIAREPEFTCAKSIADKVLSNPKIEVKFNTEIIEAKGKDMVNYAKFKNNVTGEIFEYRAKKEDGAFGIFVFVGYAPKSELFKDILELDKQGYIITNEDMETNINGVYVAGDLRPKSLRQIVTAVSDGAIAATTAERYVKELKEKLVIEDEYLEEEENIQEEKNSDENNDLGNISRKSSLLNDGLRAQLKGILSKIENEVTLVSIVDRNNTKSIELRDLVLDISDLGEKINAKIFNRGENKDVEEKINADKYPIVALLDENENYSGIKFHGVPGGHELNSFILAIYNLGGPGQGIDKEVLDEIKKLDKKTNIKVCVSLSCHLCPDVVASAQRIAKENKNIEAEMIDLANFKDIKDEFKIMSVPALIVNNKDVYFGSKKIEEILEIIK